MGDQVFTMKRNRTSSTLDQKIEFWKENLRGDEAKVFRENQDKIWIWSKDGKLGVHLEQTSSGTVERVFKAQGRGTKLEEVDDFWNPPWSSLEFSSSSLDSSPRQLRIYRSKGGAEALREHYLETLQEKGWTALNHNGEVLVFQKGSSRAWLQITPEGPQSKITLLLTL